MADGAARAARADGVLSGAVATQLRVVSYNIRHGEGIDRRVDLARAARVVRDSGAHVVGLQEVDRHYGERSGYLDQPAWLAEHLGMHVAFGATIDLDPPAPGRPRRRFGNAVLSRHPITAWRTEPLPSDGREPRGLLRAEIRAGGQAWQVSVTHLEPHDPAVRLAQARAVADLVGTPDLPAVLLADLNAGPASAELRVLTSRLVDCCADTGGRCGSTFPAPLPYRRIDFALRGPGVRAHTARAVGTFAARLASDHLPVLAALEPIGG
jgi:endonuclease/exonuclease/phosphatase family metal-dependent hydrolase